MSSNRPETSVPRYDSESAEAAKAQPDKALPIVGVESYVPHAFDLVMPTHRARDTAKLYIPPLFLQSEAVDSSLLLGHGASFTVTRQALPPGPAELVEKINMGGWVMEKVVKAPERPKYVVYKSARVAFLANGYPATPQDRRALQSVLTEFHALLHPPLLEHPNIIDFLGLAWGSNHAEPLHRLPVLVVEYGDRGTLADVQLRGPPLPNSLKSDLCLGIARGLEALHRHGIVHGDVKPENIIMVSHKEKTLVPKLADFGFAIIEDTESSEVMIGGTRTWRAPESFSPVPVQMLKYTDVYSFGLMAWSIAIDGDDPFNLMLLNHLQSSERFKEIDHLKSTDKVLAFSKLEKWLLNWQISRRVKLSSQFASLAEKMAGADPELQRRSDLTQFLSSDFLPGSQQLIKEAASKIYAASSEQVFFKDLDSLFSQTLTREPGKRDLSAVIRLLEGKKAEDLSSGLTVLTVADDATNPAPFTQSRAGQAGTDAISEKADISSPKTYYRITNTSSETKYFRRTPIPSVAPAISHPERSSSFAESSKIDWSKLGFKQHRQSWQMTRDLEPSVQNFLVKTLLHLDDAPNRFPLAACLMNGFGLRSDVDRALECLAQAARDGHQIAQAYLYRMFTACDKEIPAEIPVLQYLKDQAIRGSRAALQDLKRLDLKQAARTRELMKFGYGGVGANWFLDSQWLPGLTQSTLMSKDFSPERLGSRTELQSVIVNTKGDGLLHAGAAVGAFGLVRELLTDMNFDVNKQNQKGETALLCACRSGHPDIVKLLLDNGARASIQSEGGESPLHWLTSFDENINAAALGNDLIKRGEAKVDAFTNQRIAHSIFPGSIDVDFQMEGTPLMWAVHDNRPRIVSFLLSKGADPNWRLQKNAMSPIEWAAFYHHAECLKLMIEHLENTANAPTTTEGSRDPRFTVVYGPLVRNAVHSSDKFSMILRNRSDYLDALKSTLAFLQDKTKLVQFNMGQNETLLHYAAREAHDEACQVILESDWRIKEINQPAGHAGRTPLLESVRWNRRELFHLLIRHGADVNALSASPYDEMDLQAWTALHLFADQAHNDDLALVDDLMAAGIHVDGNRTGSSPSSIETPFLIAVRRNAFRLADRLRELGATLDAPYLRSALLVAPYPLTGLGHAVALNARYGLRALRYLLAAGAAFVVEAARTLTALHLVAMVPAGFTYIGGGVEPAELERSDFDWETNGVVAGELLQWFQEPELVDRRSGLQGKTALHLAAEHGNVRVVEKLVRAGASKELRCDLGETAANTARRAWSGEDGLGVLNKMLDWLE